MTITLPDELLQTAQMSQGELLQEIAIMLYQQQRIQLEQAAQLSGSSIDDFYQLLIQRNIVTPPTDPDDDPDELILASLRLSLQQAQSGNIHPISELWDGIDE
jgi:predicted HTH domain antitoxin